MKFFSKSFHEKNRYVELDAIRGIFALWIVIHHYSHYVLSQHSDVIAIPPAIIELGKYSIHAFFVMSGFLIFMTLEKSTHAKYFIVSRFSRLYPAYWVCMTSTALVITLSPYYTYEPVTIKQYLANLTMFQHWMSVADMDGVYWTLAVEMCFYILIFLVFIFRKQEHIEMIGLLWMGLMVFIYYGVKTDMLPELNYYYYVPLLKNGNLFVAGILFYQLIQDPKKSKKWLLILLCLAVHFIVNSIDEAISIAIIFILFSLFVFDKLMFLRSRIPFFLGFISYPLYLLHQYIGYEVINFLEDSGSTNNYVNIGCTAALIIGVSALVTFTVERPAMKFLRKKLT